MTRRPSVAGLAMVLAFGFGGVAAGATVYSANVDRCSSECDHIGAGGAGNGALDDLGDFGHAWSSDPDVVWADIDETGEAGVGVPTLAGVSEPASWALMIVGIGMVGAGLRLRRSEEREFG